VLLVFVLVFHDFEHFRNPAQLIYEQQVNYLAPVVVVSELLALVVATGTRIRPFPLQINVFIAIFVIEFVLVLVVVVVVFVVDCFEELN